MHSLLINVTHFPTKFIFSLLEVTIFISFLPSSTLQCSLTKSHPIPFALVCFHRLLHQQFLSFHWIIPYDLQARPSIYLKKHQKQKAKPPLSPHLLLVITLLLCFPSQLNLLQIDGFDTVSPVRLHQFNNLHPSCH